MLLRRKQTETRHSASLHVHKLVFYSLLMRVSGTSHGDFPHNVVGSKVNCAVAKNSSADRISEHCFTVCPRTGVLQSSEDTL